MPDVIERTVVERWKVVIEEPKLCKCGHEHYGRVRETWQAPQWHICESAECTCQVLRTP